MIELVGVSKRYGSTLAVDELSFSVQPGHVTGFLGPNGAGKSTTMRVILGLDTPTAGVATVNRRRYVDLGAPLREVGSLLEARAFHPGRTARNHLRTVARSNGIPDRRVDDVLGIVGLSEVADRRAGGFSLGMSQRLGIAAAMLGDPEVLLLDEPMNGLDTEGIRWIRDLMRRLADGGRTVFLSSHLMSEMELVADRLVVIGQGRLLADTTVTDFIDSHSQPVTVVRSPMYAELRSLIEASIPRATTRADDAADGRLRVVGTEPAEVGEIAAAHGIPLHELTTERSSLEVVYSRLTEQSVEYRASEGGPA